MATTEHTIRSWQARLPFPHNLCVEKGKKTPEAVLCGARVREARTRAQLSQSELARKLKMLPSTLGNYEQGLRKLPIRVAKGIQRETGVPAAYVMALIDEADRDLLMAPGEARLALLAAIRSLHR
jgi:transcriptional regulator with XRE-family HTH domain